ncbi:hypothetical protein Vadar_014267 [Vaccinium darrowii]|uniref:Uncharacterized protein n=1 Tax=Vaccinium darrowii TaxID=229202 RepID=A0ACB7YVT0_9ERIC|nr:hypothetical protein Vadar_014267 [Vaccinium darrowii]
MTAEKVERKNESETLKIKRCGKRGQYFLICRIGRKSKDGLNACKDLQNLGIRHDLHPQDRRTKTYLPPASFTLYKAEKQIFCKMLFDLKVPDGYSSNISNCIDMEKLKITGLKSHDCHVLMLQLLPVALKGLLQSGPRNVIFHLCAFFNRLCRRVIDREEKACLEDEIVETLCMFERFFPPSFFDIMNHAAKEGPTMHIVSPVSVNPTYDAKCKLLDWMGTGEVVAEGRWSSSDPNALVHHVPIGPGAMRVWVDVAMKRGQVHLWRRTDDMTQIDKALGSTVAWLADKVIFASSPE